jgi:GNAT superfamily N-acetyltransferase
MEIRTIATRADLKRFIELPYNLYRHDPNWIAPLRNEQWNQFDAKRNPMLDHCEYTLFLLLDGGEPVGRVSAFVDRLAVEGWKEPIGLFGSYECALRGEGPRMLLEAAVDWLRARGMRKMRGPWSFASQEWGLVLEGFTPPPVIMAPYNPPAYNQDLTDFGLAKAKDLLVYVADVREGYRFPERYINITDRIVKRYGINVRQVDMKRLPAEVDSLMAMSNTAIGDNWGYYPVTPAESQALARDLKQIIDPSAVLIAEDSAGKPIGFAIALPDINVLLRGLNGRLFPFGWLKLLIGLPKLRAFRMWALGVVPEYQGKAVDALLYRKLYEALYHREVRMEINYVLEDNVRMNNALHALGVRDLRRYRVYEMEI